MGDLWWEAGKWYVAATGYGFRNGVAKLNWSGVFRFLAVEVDASSAEPPLARKTALPMLESSGVSLWSVPMASVML